MTPTSCFSRFLLGCAFAVALCAPLSAASLVFNGSLEDLNQQWSDSGGNYMALSAGSTNIAGWTVTANTSGDIVWGQATTSDNHGAPDGQYFVDVSGYGGTAVGGLSQGLTLNAGATYEFSIDILGVTPTVTVGSATVSLSPFATINVGADIWTTYTGSFIADSSNPLLTIMDTFPGADIHFMDNVSSAETGSEAPEPGTMLLFGAGMVLVGGARFRRMRGQAKS